jgi:hypothetical protein
MPGLLPHIDPDGLLEFSVVYTDRALNHMSQRFKGVMTDIGRMRRIGTRKWHIWYGIGSAAICQWPACDGAS